MSVCLFVVEPLLEALQSYSPRSQLTLPPSAFARGKRTGELQHAQGEVARAASVLNCKRAVFGGAQQSLHEYSQHITATYRALRE